MVDVPVTREHFRYECQIAPISKGNQESFAFYMLCLSIHIYIHTKEKQVAFVYKKEPLIE